MTSTLPSGAISMDHWRSRGMARVAKATCTCNVYRPMGILGGTEK